MHRSNIFDQPERTIIDKTAIRIDQLQIRGLSNPVTGITFMLTMKAGREMWSKFYKYKLHHFLLWAAYFAFWIIIYLKSYGSAWVSFRATSIYFVFQASAFYITAYYLFPRFLYKQRYLLFAVLFLTLSSILSIPHGYLLYLFYRGADVPGEFKALSNMIQVAFTSIVTMTGLMAGVKVVVEKLQANRMNSIREQQRLESELQFLRAQTNPHFLFNAINSVYFLIKKDPDQAAQTLIRLSDLLRFQLYDCSDERIAIEKEVEYLGNFITLEKIRKGQKVNVSVDMNTGLSGFLLPPFMLMPFVENAFKHVSNYSSDENRIWIKLHREGDRFYASIENTTEKKTNETVGGIGLKNVRRRLELLYPDSHELTIKEGVTKYSVQLTLKIL